MLAPSIRALAACAALVLAGAGAPDVQAGVVDCSRPGPFRCLVEHDRSGPARDVFAAGGSAKTTSTAQVATQAQADPRAVVMWQAPDAAPPTQRLRPNDTAETVGQTGDSPLLALLLAALGIVAFVAQRRGGG